jgi:DNA-binding protein Fis
VSRGKEQPDLLGAVRLLYRERHTAVPLYRFATKLFQTYLVRRAIDTCAGNRAAAARRLGTCYATVRTKADCEDAIGLDGWLSGLAIPREPYAVALRVFQQALIACTVERCGGNMAEAARRLGVAHSTVKRKLPRKPRRIATSANRQPRA